MYFCTAGILTIFADIPNFLEDISNVRYIAAKMLAAKQTNLLYF